MSSQTVISLYSLSLEIEPSKSESRVISISEMMFGWLSISETGLDAVGRTEAAREAVLVSASTSRQSISVIFVARKEALSLLRMTWIEELMN